MFSSKSLSIANNVQSVPPEIIQVLEVVDACISEGEYLTNRCLMTSSVLMKYLGGLVCVQSVERCEGETVAYNGFYLEYLSKMKQAGLEFMSDIDSLPRSKRRQFEKLFEKAKMVHIEANKYNPGGQRQKPVDLDNALKGHVACLVTLTSGEVYLVDPTAYQFSRDDMAIGRSFIGRVREEEFEPGSKTGDRVFRLAPRSEKDNKVIWMEYRFERIDTIQKLDPVDSDLNPNRYPELLPKIESRLAEFQVCP